VVDAEVRAERDLPVSAPVEHPLRATPDPSAAMVRPVLGEFVATMLFVLVSAGAVVISSIDLNPVGVALATGFALGAMITAFRHLSGGHLNPAVTLGAWAVGEVAPLRAFAYLAAQFLGAISAGLFLRAVVPGVLYTASAGGVPSLGATMGVGRGIAVEAVATFALVLVFCATMLDRRTGWSGAGGLVVGVTAAANVIAFGAYTGAAMNPARWLGPAFAAQQWSDWYVWIAGPLIGGIAAALVYRALFPRDQGTDAPPQA
jgi:MIP family channel proteins